MAIKPKKVIGNERDIAQTIKKKQADKAVQKASGLVGSKPAARATMKDLKPLPKKNGAETVKSATKNVPAIKKAIAKATKPDTDKVASTKSKGGIEKLIQDVTNRYRVTAREARDIVTAVGTVGTVAKGKYMNDKPEQLKKSAGNLVKQVKETAKAATTGAPGSRSGTAYPGTPTGYYEPKKKGK